MTQRFSRLSLAAVLALSSLTLVSAHTPPRAGHLDVLVDGKARPLYWHAGRWYVEAIKGEEYGIRIRNPFGVRVAVALSVDGLNTIDGRDTTAKGARKWVLQPYQTVTIHGWQTSQTTARRFEFTTEARSYGAALGRVENLGIISAAFFKERIETPAPLVLEDSRSRRAAPSAPAAAGAREESASKQAAREADNSMAATGMGRETDHAVTQVRLDLEEMPATIVSLRYEFRPQLVKLGVLASPHDDGLTRRERARGFEGGFAPVPPALDR